MPRWYTQKYENIYAFMDYLLKFRELYPDVDYAIQGMIKSHADTNRNWYCPFRSRKVDTTISRIKELYGATFPILLWNIEWDEVKVISWHYPFLLLINNWYEDYTVYHHTLWDEILMSTMHVPKELVIEKAQSTFLLRNK